MSDFLSLADLAALETDEIATLMSRLPEAGLFTVRGQEVKASQTPGRTEDEPPLFRFGFNMEIVEAAPLDKKVDPEKLVGKKLNESYTLWPSNVEEAIGLLKGRYQQIGLPNKGRLGGVEGQEPGWLDGMVSHLWKVRVRRAEVNGTERAFFDWLPVKKADADEEAA